MCPVQANGMAAAYEIAQNTDQQHAVANFFRFVTSAHSFSTGGSNDHEFWQAADTMGDSLQASHDLSITLVLMQLLRQSLILTSPLTRGRAAVQNLSARLKLLNACTQGTDIASNATETQETCTQYNILKVARYLFRWTASPAVADFYERSLFNGIMGTQRMSPHYHATDYALPVGQAQAVAEDTHVHPAAAPGPIPMRSPMQAPAAAPILSPVQAPLAPLVPGPAVAQRRVAPRPIVAPQPAPVPAPALAPVPLAPVNQDVVSVAGRRLMQTR